MKNLSTLVFILLAHLVFGQQALSFSIIAQRNTIDYGMSGTVANLVSATKYRESRVPTFALSYFKFKRFGRYARLHLTGVFFSNKDDVSIGYSTFGTSTTPVTSYYPADLKAKSARLGYGLGFPTGFNIVGFELYFEPTLNLGWYSVDTNPNVSTRFETEYDEFFLSVGPNATFSRKLKKGFLRVGLVMPIFQFAYKSGFTNNPQFPKSINTREFFDFNGGLFDRVGVELGYAYYLKGSEKKAKK
ncbi:MAG: hypothetical protein IPN76_07130 [Saprospiraceae bacterium]|nr:hypothetical protein [Saprospiraceae bacterium]